MWPFDRNKTIVKYEQGQAPAEGTGKELVTLDGQAPITVTGKLVVVRPDLIIEGGALLPGVTIDMACGLLAANLRMLLKSDRIPVDVKDVDYCGRFARFDFHIPDWEGPVRFCLLAGTADQRVVAAWRKYRDGWAQKVRQLHKRTQVLDEPNRVLVEAINLWSKLREAETRLVGEDEFVYTLTAMGDALSLQTLIPPARCEPQTLVHKAAAPIPPGQAAPA
jgi:hypothetical protein